MTGPTTRPDPAAAPGQERPHLGPTSRRWLLPLYDPLTRLLGVRTVHEQLVQAAQLRPGHRVLEIGCGTGNLTLLAKARQPGATVIGLDPDLPALARARRKARRRGLDVQLDHGFADQLPHPDASVDRVLSSLMLHHVPDEQRLPALREVHRVLRPGGELHLVDLAGQHGGPGNRLRHRAPRLRDSDGQALAALLREAGFSDVRIGTTAARRMPLVSCRAVR